MIKLLFKSKASELCSDETLYQLSRITDGEGDSLIILIPDIAHGALMIGDERYKLTSGEARIPLSKLRVGEIAPTLSVGQKVFRLSPIVFDGERILPKAVDALEVGELYLALSLIAQRVAKAEERLAECERRLLPNELFKFD